MKILQKLSLIAIIAGFFLLSGCADPYDEINDSKSVTDPHGDEGQVAERD